MAALAAAVMLNGTLAVATADAQSSRRHGHKQHAYQQRYVVAESDWGKGSVRGAVRRWKHGWQVQMPRGTWIDCVRSCSETLRRATVDYWETVGGPWGAKDEGPGYFKWEFYF
ncbi:MAG: hypothetical protein ACK5JT_20765 [Hyphomicrobiaceae bacterium]